MKIQADGKFINSFPLSFFLTQGEQNVDVVEFEVARTYEGLDLSDCTFVLTAVNAAQTQLEAVLTKTVTADKITLRWSITGYFTAVAGLLELELRAVRAGEDATEGSYDADAVILKYVLSPVFVRAAAAGTSGIPTPEQSAQTLSQIAAALEAALDDIAQAAATLGITGITERLTAAESSLAALQALTSPITALTQTEYDALTTVEAARLYVIVNETEAEVSE